MYLSKKYKLKEWYSFDDDIFLSGVDFFKKKGFKPNIIEFNKHTYEQICFLISNSPKREFIENDDGQTEIEISKFAYQEYSKDTTFDCLAYTLRCCYNENLKDQEFEIIYDDDADFDDDEEMPINNPVLEKEIINV
jgi:hypothetical protein